MSRQFSRRKVLEGALAGACLPSMGSLVTNKRPVRFGIIADVHHGLAQRTEARLEAFLLACESRKLDFILQLGDFNHPDPEAAGFLKLWHSPRGPRYGVLGNHDMDMGSKAEALDLWELKDRFYSFDSGFLHFVVLDANFMRLDGKLVAYEKGNWYRGGITASWIDPEQIEWLRSDLAATRKPTIVFVHQPIDDAWEGGSVPNRAEVRRVLDESGKVAAVLQGHHHQDTHEVRNGILYWRVNSSSYAWVGEQYGRMADYDRSLFGFVEIGEGGATRDARYAIGDTRCAIGFGKSTHRAMNFPSRPSNLAHRLHFKAEGRRGIFEGESPFTRGVPNFDRFSPNITSFETEINLR